MPSNSNADHAAQKSHVFMLRLWLEDLGDGQTDWRGKVQHVNSGEVRYFRDWQTLEAFMEGQLPHINLLATNTDTFKDTNQGE